MYKNISFGLEQLIHFSKYTSTQMHTSKKQHFVIFGQSELPYRGPHCHSHFRMHTQTHKLRLSTLLSTTINHPVQHHKLKLIRLNKPSRLYRLRRYVPGMATVQRSGRRNDQSPPYWGVIQSRLEWFIRWGWWINAGPNEILPKASYLQPTLTSWKHSSSSRTCAAWGG